MDSLAALLDEHVHVVAAPVVAVGDAVAVGCILAVVGDLQTGYWIRVEIVVHVNAVDVVALHNVVNHLNNILAVLA